MKKHLLISVLAFTAAPVFAEDFYIFADAGQSEASFDAGDHANKEKKPTYSVGFGYRLHENFSFELGYRDLQSVNTHKQDTSSTYAYNSSLSTSAIDASVIGSLPIIEDSLGLYGRLGMARIKVKAEGNYLDGGGAENYTYNESANKGFYGVGIYSRVNENLDIRAEYTQYQKLDNSTEYALTNTKISTVTVGICYSF